MKSIQQIFQEKAITEEMMLKRGWVYDQRGVLVPMYRVKAPEKLLFKGDKMKHFNR